MRGKTVLAALAVLIFVAGILFFGFGSPAIVEIEIEGGGRIGTSRIQALSGFEVGKPWKASFIESAKSDILDLPQVKDVDISGRLGLPFGVRVRIEVVEREPLALLSFSDGETFWVDGDGRLIASDEKISALPLLNQVSVEENEDGEQRVSDDLMRVVREILMMPGSLLARFSEINLSAHDLEFVSLDGWSARLSVENLREELRRLDVVLKAVEREQISGWQHIDLRFEGEVTLR